MRANEATRHLQGANSSSCGRVNSVLAGVSAVPVLPAKMDFVSIGDLLAARSRSWYRQSVSTRSGAGSGMYMKIKSLGGVLSGSLSAVSKPNFARKYSLESY